MVDWPGWLAFVLALVPAAIRLPRTRSLVRHVDDPALPERLAGSRNLIAFAFSLAATLEIILWPRLALFTMPLLIVAFALAGWPLRRALFAETWSFPSYLWFYARLTFAIYGFWMLLIASPWLTDFDGRQGWLAAAVLGALLLAWNSFYFPVLRFILRATPVTSPALVERFRAVIAKTTLPPPDVEYVDMRGGVLVNALAMPGITRSGVLFTSTLLDRFDDDEVEAIFAHEVAHLEHYHPAYLRRLRASGWLLVAASVAIGPVMQATAPEYRSFLIAWPLVVLGYMIALGGHKQKHETESDLRSAALTGKPEVMVRALIKLYELMKLPRRLDPSVEVNASHPSLARRIQAIRSATGGAAETLPDAVLFAHESTSVTLHADRVVWNEREGASFTLAYSALDELRIEADSKGAAHLIASDPAGRKWRMRLAHEDVARAHAALNIVDVRLRATPAGASKWVTLGRLAAMICALAALAAWQLASVFIAAAAAIMAERPVLRAAGAAAIAGGVLTLRDGRVPDFAGILIAAGVLVLFVAWRDTREVASRYTWRVVAVIGVLALLCLIPVALAATNWLALHQAARLWPGVATASIAFAAANWPRRTPAWIAATVVAGAIGVASIALGAARTADLLVDDPFLSRLSPTRALALPAAPETTFELDVAPHDVFISPNARAIAAVNEDHYEEYLFHVGRPGAALMELPGDAAVFVDDDRLLLLDANRGVAQLRLIHVDRTAPIWTIDIELADPSLAVTRDGQNWEMLGVRDNGEFARVTGSMNGTISREQTWPIGATAGTGVLSPLIADESTLIARKAGYDRRGFGLNPAMSAWFDPWRTESRFFRIDASGQHEVMHSVLDVDCAPVPIAGEPPVCWAFDGSRTHVFRLGRDAALTPLAVTDGRLIVDVTGGWAIGWAPRPYAVHLESGKAYEMNAARGFFAAGGPFLGVVEIRDSRAVVELYRVNAR